MSVLVPDRVLQTTVTSGTGPYVLVPATAAFRNFSASYATSAKVPYCATDNQSNYEIGIGTLVIGSPDQITRGSIILSSNSNSAVSWTGTTKQIFAWDVTGTAYVSTFGGSYTALPADWGTTFAFTGVISGTFTLPAITGLPLGFTVTVKNSGTAACIVTPHTGDQIENYGVSTSFTLNQRASATLASDGTVWRVIAAGGDTLASNTDLAISGTANHDFLTFNSGTSKWVNSAHATATSFLDAMVGDSGSGGTKGLVPAPGSGDTAAGKFLKADGTFAVPPGSSGTPVSFHVVASGSSDSLTTLSVVRTHIVWNSASGLAKSQTIPDPTLYDGYDVDLFDFFGDSPTHPITITPAGTGTITIASLGSVANVTLQSAYGNLSFRANAALNTWIVT